MSNILDAVLVVGRMAWRYTGAATHLDQVIVSEKNTKKITLIHHSWALVKLPVVSNPPKTFWNPSSFLPFVRLFHRPCLHSNLPCPCNCPAWELDHSQPWPVASRVIRETPRKWRCLANRRIPCLADIPLCLSCSANPWSTVRSFRSLPPKRDAGFWSILSFCRVMFGGISFETIFWSSMLKPHKFLSER